jgi:hypothetical protein
MSRLETEVKKWQDEIMSNETKLHLLGQQTDQLELWQRRAEAELKVFNSIPMEMCNRRCLTTRGHHLTFFRCRLSPGKTGIYSF